MTEKGPSAWRFGHAGWWAAPVIAVTVAGAVVAATSSTTSTNKTKVLGQQFVNGNSNASTNGSTNSNPSSNGSSNGNGNGNGNPGHPLNVSGAVVGELYPGESAPLQVTVQNPNNQDLQLQSIAASLGTPSKGGCLSSWFSVSQYIGPAVTLPKNSSKVIALTVSMSNTNTPQDACHSATFPINFTATATG